jgi:hypothetical protein
LNICYPTQKNQNVGSSADDMETEVKRKEMETVASAMLSMQSHTNNFECDIQDE